MATDYLSLRGITKTYAGLAVVSDVSLAIRKGEILTILGPSGCGKTTTLKIVAGFIEPDPGSVLVEDTRRGSSVEPRARRRDGVSELRALSPPDRRHRTSPLACACAGCLKPRSPRQVDDMLARVRLMPFRDRYPKELSGGQQQRVALARALIITPKVLLLDEPFSQPRRQAAQAAARGIPGNPPQLQHHVGFRHARPGRGVRALRQGRGDERRRGRAVRRAVGNLFPPALALRCRLRRAQEHPRRRDYRERSRQRDHDGVGPDHADPAGQRRPRHGVDPGASASGLAEARRGNELLSPRPSITSATSAPSCRSRCASAISRWKAISRRRERPRRCARATRFASHGIAVMSC